MRQVKMSKRILLVDDDPQSLESTQKILALAGYEVTQATDGQMALEQARRLSFDVVVSDVRMPKLGGLEFLRALSFCGESIPVILMTAFGRVEDAVWAMKLGAVDFLNKPFKRQTLLLAVESALKRSRVKTSGEQLERPELLIGESQVMQSLRMQIAQVAPSAATVLLVGESGTGKERVAQCLHQQSPHSRGRFIALNCAAVPEQLIESELFGFEKGAFTGASSQKEGLFEAADGGTLLLDEIGDMPFALQAKLLRVLQEQEVRRLGATGSKKVDVRVIAATHQDLHENVRIGKFRQDLFFRLEVITLQVPPLRTRLEDLPILIDHFLQNAILRHGKSIAGIEPDALQVLQAHSWPGNVRELSNVIERAVVFGSGGAIRISDLPPHLVALAKPNGPGDRPDKKETLSEAGSTISVRVGTSLKDVEDLMIRKTLEATSGDKNMTAKLLGINSRTIYRKLDKRSE